MNGVVQTEILILGIIFESIMNVANFRVDTDLRFNLT
jgi:hypothetical protein